MTAFAALLRRDIVLSLRSGGGAGLGAAFFVLILVLAPLGLGSEQAQLQSAAPGLIWIAALLATLLGLERVIEPDLQDGTLDLLRLSSLPLEFVVLAKVAAHWLTNGLVICLLAPLIAPILFVQTNALWVLALSLLLGTPGLSFIGTAGAAIGAGVRRGGVLLALIVLPFNIPALILAPAPSAPCSTAPIPAKPCCSSHLSRLSPASSARSPPPRHCVSTKTSRGYSPQGARVKSRVHAALRQSAKFSRPRSALDAVAARRCGSADRGWRLSRAGRRPPDRYQHDAARIMHVHVPAAWMSIFVYATMAIASASAFIFKHPLGDVAAKAAAPLGAVFTGLALVTGMLWGKPTWGAWWVWDGRLTSELILFFVYIAYIALWDAIDEPTRAARMARILCSSAPSICRSSIFPCNGGKRCIKASAYFVPTAADAGLDADAALDHGARLHGVVHRFAAGPHAQRNFGPPLAHLAPESGRSNGMSFFAMGGYAAYIWPAYVTSIGALIIVGVVSWRALKRNERLVELSQSADER